MLTVLHSLISIPSHATLHPAASIILRSVESSLTIGLVLLMWMNTRREAVIVESIARLPVSPPTGQWARSSADFSRKPGAESSSLDQNVPSNMTQSTFANASKTEVVILPTAER